MKTLIALVSLAVTLLTVRGQTIDFTQRTFDAIEDGVPMRHLYFSDGVQRIVYRPHASWSRSGDAQAAIFGVEGSNDASVKIENAAPGASGIPFDERGLMTLRKAAGLMLPSDAFDVTQAWETVNPVVLQGWTSFEIGFDYRRAELRHTRSVLFINLDPHRQIHFIVSAPSADFKSLHQTAYRTLATWYQAPIEAKP